MIVSNIPAATAKPPPTLRTSRMTLRPLQPGDRAEFIRMQRSSHEHLTPWMPSPTDTGLDAGLNSFFELNLRRSADAHVAGSSVRLMGFAADGRIAGSFNLNNIVRGVGQMCDAGWYVAGDFAGQGFATEGVTAILKFAFALPPHGLGLHRVQAGIIPRNTRSIRVAEKCGMRREGLALRYIKIARKWEDHIIFAKTVEDETASPQASPSR